MTHTLTAESRTDLGKKAASLREAGKLPAVIYGAKEASAAIAVSAQDFKKALKQAGESTIVTLQGLGEEKEVLIHDISFDPVSGEPRHVDFYAIEKGKPVQVEVPLNFVGESPAVKNLGGVLVKVLHEVEIEALPKDLPHEIEVDISSLTDIDSQIHVSDIVLPSGVTMLAEPEEVVVLAAAATEEEAEPVAAVDMASIEVEQKGKKEEEGSEEAAS